jgi:membrane-associated phospholipid phosphatase
VNSHFAIAVLCGFIAGVAVTSVAGWVFRERIRDWLRRRG